MICLSWSDIKNLWHFLKRGCLMKWHEPDFSFLWSQTFFLGKLTLILHTAFPPKARLSGSSGLSSLHLSWLSKSLFSRLESRYQDKAMSACVPAHAQTLADSSRMWVLLTHVASSRAAFSCFAQDMPGTLTATGKRELHPANGKVYPVWWLHIHPSNRALSLS